MKKCVVIGSGLGGLSCGCILAKNGYHVTILEQGTQIGGCLQCFRRGDAVFDTGMHYIGSADYGQPLNTILRYLGVEQKVKLSRLNPDGYDVVSLRGKHYRFANGRERFIEAMAENFPQCREELAQYYDLIKFVASQSSMHSLSRDVNLYVNAEYQRRSVNEVIDGVVKNPLLCQVLAGLQPLYAGVKDRTPFSTHALISDFYEQSAFRIVGGSSVLADALADNIHALGGKVLVRKKAVSIECNDTHATAVVTADGEHYDADLIISAIHPLRTVELTDSKLIRPVYRKRLEGAPNTTSAFTVYLKFRKDMLPYLNSNLYIYRGDTTWGCENYSEQSWPKCILYMHFCHEEHPKYAHTGEIITYMSFSEMAPWIGTKQGHRGEDYETFKRRKAEQLIDIIEQEMPGLRRSIETYYTSTPLTYLDYTGIPDGAMYGMAKDIDMAGMGQISCKTRIPNLMLTGQSTVLHGMLGVLAGSLVTCSEIIGTDEIFAQLKGIDKR